MPADSRRSREQSWSLDDSWRRRSRSRPNAEAAAGVNLDDPAHRYGFEYATRYVGRHWDEVEPELRRHWEDYEHRGEQRWDDVKNSVREAYQRAAENEATRD